MVWRDEVKKALQSLRPDALKPHLFRGLRVLLVFALVFGTSLRLEYSLAFGAQAPAVTVDELADHEEDKLTDLVLYQSTDDNTGWVPLADKSTVVFEEGDSTAYFVAVPVWNGALPEGYHDNAKLATVPSAKFATWEVAGTTVTTVIDPGTNVLTADPTDIAGSTDVLCQAESIKLRFTLNVPEVVDPEPVNPDPEQPDPDNPDDPADHEPELVSVQILDSLGDSIPEGAINFDSEEIGNSMQLEVLVSVKNLNAKDEGSLAETGDVATYNSYTDASWDAFSEGKLSLSWSTSDPEVATISDEGLLTAVGQGTCKITCTATVLSTSEEMPYALDVTVGAAAPVLEDPQGESHPQDSLRVRALAGTASAIENSGAGRTGDEPATGDESETSGETATEDNPDETGSSAQGEEESSGDGEESSKLLVDKTYSLDDLRKLDTTTGLPVSTETFAMKMLGQAATIQGEGFSLKALLENAFAEKDLSLGDMPIESVDFIDYRGIRTTIDWPTLELSNAMVATKSRVLSLNGEALDGSNDNPGGDFEGEGESGEGESGEGGFGDEEGLSLQAEGDSADSGELLDNTRFRILFNSSSDAIDANGLRYINNIQLNMKVADAKDFEAYVSYNPVPVGVEAVFVAVPVNTISGSWDCQWEESTDKGKTWKKMEGETGQSLTLLTTAERLGNFYRVIIVNSAVVDGQSKTLTATSDPVEMVEGTSLVVSYDPPKPGGIAVFRSSIFGYNGDVSALKYIWEFTENGGVSWQVIPDQNKPTLELQTEDTSASDSNGGSSGDQGANNLIYVRLRALTPTGSVFISNVVPLTVLVGEGEGGGAPGSSDDGRTDAPAGPQGGEVFDIPNFLAPILGGVNSPSDPTIIEMSDLIPQEALDPNGNLNAPAAPLDLDSEIIDQLDELSQAQDQLSANQPGARWTALKTLNPSDEELASILGDNPIAPLVLPTTLGLVVAGGLEKLFAFRRQLA